MAKKSTSKVLIVEDSHSIQVIYTTVLEKAGYHITVAASGSEALETTKAQPFDVILLDIVLLDMDGITFLQSFGSKEHPETRVIVMSNMDDPELIEKASALGATRYILKRSLTPKLLLDAVTGALADGPAGV